MENRLDLSAAGNWLGNAIRSNKELMLPIAGVFFFLPNLAFSFLTKDSLATFQAGVAQFSQIANRQPGNPGEVIAIMPKIVAQYYSAIWPWLLPVMLLSVWGSIILYRIFLQPGRENVGEAIRASLPMILPIFLANLLVALISVFASALPFLLGAITGNAGIIALMFMIGFAASLSVTVRLYLYAAAMIDTDTKKPVTGMANSWAVTSGNFWRIFLYSTMLLIGAAVVYMILALIVGFIDAMISGQPKPGDLPLLSTILSAIFSAAIAVLIAGATSSVWRQLSSSTHKSDSVI